MSQPSQLSHYEIIRPIGRGMSATVHLARMPNGTEVALKIPEAETLADPSAAQRFGNEVRLSLQLQHPHLVRTFGGIPFGPDSFLALQYYQNGSLGEQLEKSHPTETECLQILHDIAQALDFLHESGAVHQDVKPQNVYVANGRAALGDLGSAYFTAQGSQTSGSPFYMAPEVYRGEPTSPASDVYSFGIMMYELLARRRPFKGEQYDELMNAHLNSFAQPLSQHAPHLRRSLLRMTDKALSKNPASRPGIKVILQALHIALHPEEKSKTAPESKPSVPAGRHAATEQTTPKEEPKRWSFPWNPFKRE